MPFWDYDDFITSGTPVPVPANTWTNVPNDGVGINTYLLGGVPLLGDVWDIATQSFNFANFENNSMVDIRIDVEVTTTVPNQDVLVDLIVGDGTASEFSLPFIRNTFKAAGTHRLLNLNTLYLRDEIKSLPTRFKIFTDGIATMVVNGWLVRTFIKVD